MSTNQYNSTCPNCGKDMVTDSNHRPFETVSHFCPHCGFSTYVKAEYLNLEALNEQRASFNEVNGDNSYPPLKKLPKQDPEYE